MPPPMEYLVGIAEGMGRGEMGLNDLLKALETDLFNIAVAVEVDSSTFLAVTTTQIKKLMAETKAWGSDAAETNEVREHATVTGVLLAGTISEMGEGVNRKQHLIGNLRLRFIGKVVQLLMKRLEFQQKFDSFRGDLGMVVDQGFVARKDIGFVSAEFTRNIRKAMAGLQKEWEGL